MVQIWQTKSATIPPFGEADSLLPGGKMPATLCEGKSSLGYTLFHYTASEILVFPGKACSLSLSQVPL